MAVGNQHAAVEQTTRMHFSDWGGVPLEPNLLAFGKRNICCYKQAMHLDIQVSVRARVGEVNNPGDFMIFQG